MTPNKIILEGVVGSTAYGLDHADSDVDLLGVFVEPTHNLIGLNKPKETYAENDPDSTYHEVGKFLKLAIAANPTILELLFLDNYRQIDYCGHLLLDNRHLFLTQRIKQTFGGFAMQQIDRLIGRGDGSFSSDTRKRKEKHARHCFRLLQQGRRALETGTLTVRVPNRDEIMAVGVLSDDELLTRFAAEFMLMERVTTKLPEQVDLDRVNELLLFIRRVN